jgi:hypothetical protein
MAESIFEEKSNQPVLTELYKAVKEISAILKEMNQKEVIFELIRIKNLY